MSFGEVADKGYVVVLDDLDKTSRCGKRDDEHALILIMDAIADQDPDLMLNEMDEEVPSSPLLWALFEALDFNREAVYEVLLEIGRELSPVEKVQHCLNRFQLNGFRDMNYLINFFRVGVPGKFIFTFPSSVSVTFDLNNATEESFDQNMRVLKGVLMNGLYTFEKNQAKLHIEFVPDSSEDGKND